MPVVKLAATKDGRRLANYLQRDDKGQDRAVFVSESNNEQIERVNSAQHAEKDFQAVREQYGKTDGVQAHMAYISFKRDDLGDLARADGKPDWEKIEQFGHEYARRAGIAEKHQYYIVAHDDKANPHLHLVWNAVSDKDGSKYHSAKNENVDRMRDVVNKLSREHGILYEFKQERNAEKVPDKVIQAIDKRRAPEYSWKRDLQYRIRDAAARATSWDDFKSKLRAHHVEIRERGSGVSYSFKDDSGAKRVARGARLGEAYTREDIERRFELHRRLAQTPGLEGVQRFGREVGYEREHFTSWKQEARAAFREAERRAHSPEEFHKLAQERGLTIKKVPQPIRTETTPTPKTLQDIKEEIFKQELRQRELETGRKPSLEEARALASQMTGITPERAEALYSAEHEAARRGETHEGPGSRQEDNRSHEAERPLQGEPKTLQDIKEEIFKQELRQRELETGHRQTPAEASAFAAEAHDITTKRAYELYEEYVRESRATASGNPDSQQDRPEAQHQEGSLDEAQSRPKTFQETEEQFFRDELRQRELETGHIQSLRDARALASQMTEITPERAYDLYNEYIRESRAKAATPDALQDIREQIFKQELRQRELETGHRQTPAEASVLAAEAHDITTKRAYELYEEYVRESRAGASGNPDPQQERPEAQHQEGSPDEAQSRPKTFQETEEQFFRDELRQRELETGHIQSLKEARALASQMTEITPERTYDLYNEYIRESRAKAATPDALQDIREQIFKQELRQRELETGRRPSLEEARALASQMTGITPERAEALYSAGHEAARRGGQEHTAEQYHYELHYQDRYGVEHVATPEVLRNGTTDRDLEMRIARTRDNPIQERAQSATPTLAIGAATRSIESISQAITREVERNSNPTGGIPDYGPVRERVRRHSPDDDGLRSRHGLDNGGW